MVERLGIVPRIAAEADDMAMMRLLARADAGIAIIPPIVVQDELASGSLVELARLNELTEVFCAVTVQRRFPNNLLAEVLVSREDYAWPFPPISADGASNAPQAQGQAQDH
jgi:LysR family transcriptional activator of nhaA